MTGFRRYGCFGKYSSIVLAGLCFLILVLLSLHASQTPWQAAHRISGASSRLLARHKGGLGETVPRDLVTQPNSAEIFIDDTLDVEEEEEEAEGEEKQQQQKQQQQDKQHHQQQEHQKQQHEKQQQQPSNKTFCPKKSKQLVGTIQTYLDPVNISTVESKYPEVRKGGNFRPKECTARERLAVIIPCRNRTQHLHILLNNLLRLLIKQRLDFTIFVIDQDLPTTFNRGMLFNVGYLEALKRGSYDCFIFHDVDMIPTNDKCLYRCTHNPRHFLSGVSKWKYRLPYKSYFGGVVSFTRDQYRKINGDSNLYFGWGGEDDDLRARILHKGYSLLRYPQSIGRYDTISHQRDSGNKANPARFKLVKSAKARQDLEGLNTARYTVTSSVTRRLYTKIQVYINMTEIIQTAPADDRSLMQVLLKDPKAFDEEVVHQERKSTSTTSTSAQIK
ncbi:hypothetical protein RRG08_023877 [Elysia crispata]|uniref:Beta-1,4-galactosyltransferase n=1 Tax=Elysia crispata TaxID=231223 RepID=A0AAE1E4T6_9GAST|nr:hypothetical protein RRG08_023877 [Elysia crispata]